IEMLKTNNNYYVMVDYAHTPNGIKQLLKFVHTLNINRSIVVQGVAGERDYLKRPIMGKTLVNNASYVIFTYEDPRSENPIDIINMMIKDIKDDHDNYEIIVDRHDAIKKAVNMAKEKDIVLILGKGNETYQKLKNEVIYFNDIEEAYKAIEAKNEKSNNN
ncbi:MAG: cyanophycin synthetase, partial [Bacilli bacterium]